MIRFAGVAGIAAVLLVGACQHGDSVIADEDRTARNEATASRLPNIVLVIGDDFGAPYHGFMGNRDVQSPTLDALAARGIVFRNGYGPSNHCRPALRSMVTGLLPIQYDAHEAQNQAAYEQSSAWVNETPEEREYWSSQYRFHSMRDFETLPGLLAGIGYVTWQGGKWWEYSYENGHFTHGMTTGWAPEDVGKNDWFLKLMGGDGRMLARKDNQAAYDFIAKAGDRPFFLWYAPELPHYPFEAPRKYVDLYDGRGFSTSAVQYYANCSLFDDRLGELLAYLDEHGKLDNTLIVYINDNGWEQEPQQEFVGDPMRFNNGGDKGKLGKTDLSFRTPVIFAWPGKIGEGRVAEALIHAADVPATILDYVGLELADGAYGQSFADVISGERDAVRDEIVGRITQLRWEGDMMGRKANGYWIRRDSWFLSIDLDSGETVLTNIATDPKSDRNMAADRPLVVAELKTRIHAWRDRYEN